MYKILLVEDEPHLLELYQEELQDEGYEVMSTMDGEEAVLLTKKNFPDLVVLDIKIKKLHGLEGLEKIKEFKKSPAGLSEFSLRDFQVGLLLLDCRCLPDQILQAVEFLYLYIQNHQVRK